MKTLIMIRHAKSSWDVSSMRDFDRPLNHRGKKDAPIMAKNLLDRLGNIELFISSPAKRAKETAVLFAEVYKKKEKEIIFIDELYHASASVIYNVIKNSSNQFQSIAVFTHNPGITEIVNSLTSVKTDNVPTCGIFAVKAETSDWQDFDMARKDFMFFDYPKLSP
jgi:phosphohistidine phosphatase